MTMYASTAGKSGGEFFTPQEVSELLARVTVVGKSEVNMAIRTPAVGTTIAVRTIAKHQEVSCVSVRRN
ncbi:N-6 DNA methylase [Caldichromatium japonicum]|uniref:N-6 DNA methylase n=1 Tax=Caldichromatium japonicum TaxID=2699430 RepID=UPI001B3548B5|nr:N-6 DNA methylase [Caldichromatium japonicum]